MLTGFARRALTLVLAAAVLYQLQALAGNSGYSRELLARSLQRSAGEVESMPPQVVEARKLVVERGVDVLQLAPSIAADPFLQQRAIEGLYPVRVAARAPVMLARRDDGDIAGCVELHGSASMGLYECHAQK
jgi:hypothetical protein